jgi:cytochrome c554/c'-like protein
MVYGRLGAIGKILRRARLLFLVTLASAAPASNAPEAHCDTGARMPGPARESGPVRDLAEENARCAGCHDDIGREWRASLHAQADTDPVFRRALAIEPLPFCRGCHAPEADPRADAPARLSALGVGCVTCHVTDAGPNAATLSARPSGPPAPHAVRRASELATAAACASCHEFDFPIQAPGQAPERMQSTVSEHAQSAYADVSCASCHMPLSTGRSGKHASHLFGLGPDHAMLRAAVSVRAVRTSPSRVTLLLTPGEVGHAFPTGDLFRRLVVSAEAVGEDWFVLGEASRALRRRFEMRETVPGQTVRHLVGDDRVGAGRTEPLELDVGERARGRPIAWRVEYQRVEHPLGKDESAAVVADSIVVADGLVPATTEERP